MDSPSSNLYPANSDSPAREKLLSLRVALLRLHKTLLNMERRDYEREHGYVNTGELFRLVIDHAQFAWLHNISEFVVRIDETLTAKEPVTANRFRGQCIAKNRHGKFAAKNFKPADMIAVFVREKNAIELFWRDTTMFQAQHQLSRAQPTIDKNFAMISRDKRAVSRAPAAEHRQAEHGS